ncbi:MAG: hypothetical protein M3336_10520 [Chloroflexota bacterium]|nr:hypothetical protein [Chloroflexota bacterium]
MYSNHGWSYSSSVASQPTSAYRRRRLRLPRIPRLPRPGPLPLALLVVGLTAWYHFAFDGFSVEGMVGDAETGGPIAGARLWSTRGGGATSAQDGTFSMSHIKPPEVIGAEAPGYLAWTQRVASPFEPIRAGLQPVSVEITTVDADTGLPVDARLAEPNRGRLMGAGVVRIAPVQTGQRFTFEADGYAPAEATFSGEASLRLAMQPRLSGRVVDARAGQGLPGARVSLGSQVLMTDDNGGYELRRRPVEGQLTVLLPGYRRARIDLAQSRGLDVQLEPFEARGIYMTYFAIGGDDYRREMYRLLDSTEINAVVIDVKGDYGLLSYRSRVPLAEQIGANAEPTIDDLDALVKSLHDRGSYAIARIVVFKDNVLARNGHKAGLDIGVKDRRNGQLWVDGENLAWVDPFQQPAWEYNIALAREAIERGFDEVQFDYIRFATDPSPNSSVSDIVYSQPFVEENRVNALKSFLHRAHEAVNDAGGFLGMDTFGYTTWWNDDGGIGQHLEVLADDIDYYCPMVYPSTFNAGLPGKIPYPEVVRRPYDVIYHSLVNAQTKLAGKRVVVRPWLQYFDDYPWATRFRYDAPQIEAQKKAVADARSLGWMLWNAGSLFKRGGIATR